MNRTIDSMFSATVTTRHAATRPRNLRTLNPRTKSDVRPRATVLVTNSTKYALLMSAQPGTNCGSDILKLNAANKRGNEEADRCQTNTEHSV